MRSQQMSAVLAGILLATVTLGCSYFNVGLSKNPVDNLVALCKDGKLNDAAKHMRYWGQDKSKKDQAGSYDAGDADERRQIEMSCKRFKFMSETTYTVSPERMEQGFYVYDVEVKSGSGKIGKELWAFKKTGSDYVLVDID